MSLQPDESESCQNFVTDKIVTPFWEYPPAPAPFPQISFENIARIPMHLWRRPAYFRVAIQTEIPEM